MTDYCTRCEVPRYGPVCVQCGTRFVKSAEAALRRPKPRPKKESEMVLPKAYEFSSSAAKTRQRRMEAQRAKNHHK
jgi:predicted RNA-binding protein with PUA domain